MGDTTSTAPTAPSVKTPRDNALQDTKLANEIALAQRLLETVKTKPALAAALAQLGYDDKEISEGTALHAAAREKFSQRQAKLAIAGQDKAARDQAYDAVAEEFSSYRQTVQTCYKDTDRTNLGASGRLSEDFEVFDTFVRTAYTTALQEPYATKLATRGFKPERIKVALAALTALATNSTTSKASLKAAEAATKARDAAGKAMNSWTASVRKIAKANLKKSPELLGLLQE